MSRRKRYLLAGVLIVTVAAFGLLAFTGPTSPDGYYVSPSTIGAIGDWYMELSDGKVTWVLHEERGDTYRELDGYYTNTGAGWIMLPKDGNTPLAPNGITCSRLGLRLRSPDGSEEFWRRRFYHGRRPDWMLDHLPWCIQ